MTIKINNPIVYKQHKLILPLEDVRSSSVPRHSVCAVWQQPYLTIRRTMMGDSNRRSSMSKFHFMLYIRYNRRTRRRAPQKIKQNCAQVQRYPGSAKQQAATMTRRAMMMVVGTVPISFEHSSVSFIYCVSIRKHLHTLVVTQRYMYSCYPEDIGGRL